MGQIPQKRLLLSEPPRPVVVFVHGYLSPGSGRLDVDKLKPFFKDAGFDVRDFDYGFNVLLGLALYNDDYAKRLAELSKTLPPGSIVISHSNGCLLVQDASLRFGATFELAILISPALDNKAVFGPSLRKVYVLYSSKDFPLALAQFIPNWLVPWGDMGRRGYLGRDKRVEPINKSDKTRYAYPSFYHLDVFHEPRLSYWAAVMIDWIWKWLRSRVVEVKP